MTPAAAQGQDSLDNAQLVRREHRRRGDLPGRRSNGDGTGGLQINTFHGEPAEEERESSCRNGQLTALGTVALSQGEQPL